MAEDGITYCGEQAREQDRDRFRVSLFEPLEIRRQIWALLAFNSEIAKTREVVTETQIGHIRLQWWRDKIQEVYDQKTAGLQNHQILSELEYTINKHCLAKDHFDHLIYAREFDLEDVPPSSVDGLIKYAELTSQPLAKLVTDIEGVNVEEKVLNDVSAGYAITGLIRSIPYHARQNRLFLPSDMLREEGIGLPEIVRGKKQDKLKNIVAQIHDIALKLLSYPQSQSQFLNLSKLTALSYLKQMKNLNFDVYRKTHENPPISLFLKLLFAKK